MASGALGIGERINGVNLGNWLVLERWMKLGIFAASGEADEIWLHRATESAELETLLTRHRDTYITEADSGTLPRMAIWSWPSNSRCSV